MSRELLAEASDELNEAAESAGDDLRDRIASQAEMLSTLAEADHDPDHGRLARHMNTLAELAEDATGDVRDHVVSAREKVSEYREGVEGV